MIFVSTGGWKNQSASESCKNLLEHGLNEIELSGGLFSQNSLSDLKALAGQCKLQVHNYFPPPEVPFVLNLASNQPDVIDKSIQHVMTSMEWSVELGRPVYSFHAGFLVDPQVNELGNKIAKSKLMDREDALHRFIERVNNLSERALELGVSLLIENNVLMKDNLLHFGSNPFLMTDSSECEYVMKNTPDNVNMLLDVAHLKVSAQSLQYDPVELIQKCDDWIQAYHLSDNDGTKDSNQVIRKDSWFWSHLKRGLDCTLEIYGIDMLKLKAQRDLTNLMLQTN